MSTGERRERWEKESSFKRGKNHTFNPLYTQSLSKCVFKTNLQAATSISVMIHSAFIMSEVRMVAREIRSEEETWMCGKKIRKTEKKRMKTKEIDVDRYTHRTHG